MGLVNCTARDRPAFGGMSLKKKGDIVAGDFRRGDGAVLEIPGGDCATGDEVDPVRDACRLVIGS